MQHLTSLFVSHWTSHFLSVEYRQCLFNYKTFSKAVRISLGCFFSSSWKLSYMWKCFNRISRESRGLYTWRIWPVGSIPWCLWARFSLWIYQGKTPQTAASSGCWIWVGASITRDTRGRNIISRRTRVNVNLSYQSFHSDSFRVHNCDI